MSTVYNDPNSSVIAASQCFVAAFVVGLTQSINQSIRLKTTTTTLVYFIWQHETAVGGVA